MGPPRRRHGPREHPNDTVVRELEEETGYRIETTGFLGIDSFRHVSPRRFGRRPVDRHGVRLICEGKVIAGDLHNEPNGSTDMAAWHPLEGPYPPSIAFT